MRRSMIRVSLRLVFVVVLVVTAKDQKNDVNILEKDQQDVSPALRRRSLTVMRASDRIVNGNVTQPGSYPFFAHLLLRPYDSHDEITRGRLCGGALIGAEWILTASHCLLERNDKTKLLGTLYGFEVGFYCRRDDPKSPAPTDLSDNCGVASHQVAIEEAYFPREFNASRWYYYDVAWVKLARPILDLPYAVPDNGSVLESLFSQMKQQLQPVRLRALGRGANAEDLTSDYLEAVDMPLVATSYCESLWGKSPGIFRNVFCLQAAEGASTCAGDSGGPVLSLLDSNQNHPSHFVRSPAAVVVGVNSGGRFETGPECVRSTIPNLYGQVGAFYSEIHATICKSSASSDLRPLWCDQTRDPESSSKPPSSSFLEASNCQMGSLQKERSTLFYRDNRKPTKDAKKCRWLRRQPTDRIERFCTSVHSDARQQCPQTCHDEEETALFQTSATTGKKSCRWLRRQALPEIQQLCGSKNSDARQVCPQTCHACGGAA